MAEEQPTVEKLAGEAPAEEKMAVDKDKKTVDDETPAEIKTETPAEAAPAEEMMAVDTDKKTVEETPIEMKTEVTSETTEAKTEPPPSEVKMETSSDAKVDDVKANGKESERNTDKETSEGVSDIEKKIITQMEFYFGDMNLPRDRFLLQEIKDDADGWVPLQTMTKFNRLVQISDDIAVLAAAMRKSTTGLMEVSEDGLKVRRSPNRPLPEVTKDQRDDLKKRSVYAKGFPENSTLDELLEFFRKVGKTDHVQMRRTREKDFKGSCMVVYSTAEAAEKFLASEETAKYGETELKRLYKDAYFASKVEERKKIKEEESKKRQEQREKYKKKQEDDKKADLSKQITHGAVLHIVKVPDGTLREDLKGLFEEHGTVKWVEFDKGDPSANLRFDGENGAKIALEKICAANDGKVTLKEEELECKVLEGEEELGYWRNMFSRKSHHHSRDNRGDNRGGGRYSKSNKFYGKSRKRRGGAGDGDGDDGKSEAKVSKTDDN